jgi:hypothetical protein
MKKEIVPHFVNSPGKGQGIFLISTWELHALRTHLCHPQKAMKLIYGDNVKVDSQENIKIWSANRALNAAYTGWVINGMMHAKYSCQCLKPFQYMTEHSHLKFSHVSPKSKNPRSSAGHLDPLNYFGEQSH